MALKEMSRGKKLDAEYLNTVTVKISYVGGGEEKSSNSSMSFLRSTEKP